MSNRKILFFAIVGVVVLVLIWAILRLTNTDPKK